MNTLSLESLLSWTCILFSLPVGVILLLKPSVIAKKVENPAEQKKKELPIRMVGIFFLILALVCLL